MALARPSCRGALVVTGAEEAGLACTACGARHPSRFGIPILLPPDLLPPRDGSRDAQTHKERQIAFFDGAPADDFGVTRPRGAPELYGAGYSARSSTAASSGSRVSCPGRQS